MPLKLLKPSHCPDCSAAMQRIKLIDATFHGDRELRYAAASASEGLLGETIPTSGTVYGKLCPRCGRILLHGRPDRARLKSRRRTASGDTRRRVP